MVTGKFFFPLFQVTTLWFYSGPNVDEAELVLFGVGFLGGDLDPIWNHYGHLGMYFLGLLYYLIGSAALVFGEYESLTDYAVDFTFSGHFFVIARYFMALCMMVSIALCALILDHLRCNRWVILILVLCVSISPIVIKYANYIRTDTLVTLFTVCILFIAVRAQGFLDCLCLAIFTAAAVACKISAVTLGGVLAVVLGCLFYRKKIGWLSALSIPIVCLILIQGFAPYMDYVELIRNLLFSEGGGVKDVSRTYHTGLFEKADRILDFHVQSLGSWICILSLFSVITVFSKYRKIVSFSWLLVFLSVLPYLFGSTLRDYWFIPTYALITFLAIISALYFFELARKYFGDPACAICCAFVALLFVSGPLYAAVGSYMSLVDHQAQNPITNRDAAREWLEEKHLGVNPILIDKNYSWVYPKVYDPAHLNVARYMSLFFIYDRAGNQFLSSIFENYLYTEYVKKNDNIRNLLTRIAGLRLDFEADVSRVVFPKVCSKYTDRCYSSKIHALNDIVVVSGDDQQILIEVTGSDPYIVYSVTGIVPVDGSYTANIDTDSKKWELRYDFGNGYTEKPETKMLSGNQAVPIILWAHKPSAHKWGPGEKWTDKVRNSDTVLFVTSNVPYKRFEHLRSKAIDPNDKYQNARLAILKWHDRVIQSKKVKVFDSDPGPIIEIYNIADFED